MKMKEFEQAIVVMCDEIPSMAPPQAKKKATVVCEKLKEHLEKNPIKHEDFSQLANGIFEANSMEIWMKLVSAARVSVPETTNVHKIFDIINGRS